MIEVRESLWRARYWVVFAPFALASVLFYDDGRAIEAIRHEAYIWQFEWTQSVDQAVLSHATAVDGWRVLAGIVDPGGRVRRSRLTVDALRTAGHKAILVFRVPSPLKREHHELISREIRAVVDAWPGDLVGGVEIDHDSPTSHLLSYRDFLRGLRKDIPGRPLSITLLPTWMTSPSFAGLVAAADSTVLQVHAVSHPDTGLFDPRLAERWVKMMASVSRRPFWVALPTYGSRVSWAGIGKVSAVESEAQTLEAGSDAVELFASPYDLSNFVRRLKDGRHRHLQGIVWFRLPTRQDKRAWTSETWRQVMAGAVRGRTLSLLLRPADVEGVLFDLVLRNEGRIDAIPPVEVRLPAHCPVADGTNGYRPRYRNGGLSLIGAPGRPIRAGAMRTVGWARCASTEGGHSISRDVDARNGIWKE